MSSPISFGGLVSGLPTEDLITQLMSLERRPLLALQKKQAEMIAKKSAWQLVRGQLQGVMGKLDALRFTSGYEARKATVSDENVLRATASATAPPGVYNIEVESIAQAHSVASAVFASDTQALGLTGSLTLNGREIAVSASDSLNSLRQRINAISDIGVQASIVQTAPNAYQLVLTSRQLGAAGQISFNHVQAQQGGDVFTVGVEPEAAVGQHTLTVTAPATAARLTGNAEAATANGALTFTLNGQQLGELSVLAGETAQDVARRINEVYRGLLQAEVDDDSGYLTVRSVATGATQTLTIADGAGFGLSGTVSGTDAVYTLDGVAGTAAENKLVIGDEAGKQVTITWGDDLTGPETLELGVSRGAVLEALGLADAATGVALRELTAARDAVVKINGLTVTRDSNTLQNVLPGLSLTLAATGTTQVTVAEDTQAVVSRVKEFVDAYNNFMVDLHNRIYFKPDSSADLLGGSGAGSEKKADILYGESLLREIQSDLRRLISNPIVLGAGEVYSLADIGITTVGWGDADFYAGKLQLDTEKLTKALTEQPELVQELFGAKSRNAALGGTATAFLPDGTPLDDLVPPDIYGTGNLTNGITDPSFWGLPGGGWQSAVAGPVNVVISLGQVQTLDAVGLHMLNSAQYPAAQYALKEFEVEYWDGSAWIKTGEVADNKTGYVRVDFEAPVTTDQIRLVIKETNDPDGYARLLHVDAYQVNDGAATRLHRQLRNLTSAGGVLDERARGFDSFTRDLDDRIRMMEERIAKREETMRRQFTAMEMALGRLASQSSWLAGQLTQLQNNR